ncbi:XMAP215 family protein [Giardia muris]|uniref:XMAP215 family protein n=1 Tax=Giardia muris TaxID=5742 RepID=A0A4Z1SXP2_GIAMU|nr:XMAP215 family protein [Giardia muris]|eukprot:TNJ26453.1 XMAP215 family protein [Giardia muris]
MAEEQGDFVAALKDRAFKVRKEAFEQLEEALQRGDSSLLEQAAPHFAVLLKDSNALVLKKALDAFEQAFALGLIPQASIPAICSVLIDAGLSQTKTSLKDQVVKILTDLAAKGEFGVVVPGLINGLQAKSPKVAAESATTLLMIVRSQPIQTPLPSFVKSLVPALQHKDAKTRRTVMEVAAVVAQTTGLEALKNMIGPSLPKQFVAALEGVITELENTETLGTLPAAHSNSAGGDANAARSAPQPVVKRLSYDPFDATTPMQYHLPKTWAKQITDKNWKERKQALDDVTGALAPLVRIDRSLLQIPQLFKQFREIIDADLSVAVVSGTLRLAGLLATLVGPLGPYGSTTKGLMMSCTNRLKERKAPVVTGYSLFMHSLLVHSHKMPELSADLWAVALPHKNPEVKEDVCKLYRSLWATEIVYNTVYQLGLTSSTVSLPPAVIQTAMAQAPTGSPSGGQNYDYSAYKSLEDVVINYLMNDGFPNTQKTLAEGTPVNGELSPGLQLKTRTYRERAALNSMLAEFCPEGGKGDADYDLAAFNTVFDALDKLMSDAASTIRIPAIKAFAFGVVAHVTEVLAVFGGTVSAVSVLAQNVINSLKHRISSKDPRKQGEINDLIKKICMATGRKDVLDIITNKETVQVGTAKIPAKVISPPQPPPSRPLVQNSPPDDPPPSHLPRMHVPTGGMEQLSSGGEVSPENIPSTTTRPASTTAPGSGNMLRRVQQKPAAPSQVGKQPADIALSTNPTLYEARKGSSSKWLVDPFNAEHPLSPQLRDELYGQLIHVLPQSFVSEMFIRQGRPGSAAGIPKAVDTRFTGSQKSILDAVGTLCTVVRQNPEGAVAQRDLLLKYLSLLFCDGFTSPTSPNTAQLKAALQLGEELMEIYITAELVLTLYDLEFLFPVLLSRLEQFNLTQLKQQITSLVERHVHITSFENIIQVCLVNMIGRGAKMQLRQIPTRLSIVRLVTVMAEASRDNDHILEVTPAHIQSLLTLYKPTGMSPETYTFTEGYLSANYPQYKGGNARSVLLGCLAALLNASDGATQRRLLSQISRTVQGKDYTDLEALLQLLPVEEAVDGLLPDEPELGQVQEERFESVQQYLSKPGASSSIHAVSPEMLSNQVPIAEALRPSVPMSHHTSLRDESQYSPQDARPVMGLANPSSYTAPSFSLNEESNERFLSNQAATPPLVQPTTTTSIPRPAPSNLRPSSADIPQEDLTVSNLGLPLTDEEQVELVSPEKSTSREDFKPFDSVRTPTLRRGAHVRPNITFDNALSGQILELFEGSLYAPRIREYKLALKKLVLMTRSAQVDAPQYASRLVLATSRMCRFFAFCDETESILSLKVSLMALYAQFVGALCINPEVVLCCTRRALYTILTDMLLFVSLLFEGNVSAASYCYSALLDMTMRANLTDVLVALLTLASRFNEALLTESSLIRFLPIMNPDDHYTPTPNMQDVFLADNACFEAALAILVGLIRKLRGPTLSALTLAHDRRMAIATHIFRASDLTQQADLFAGEVGGANIIWERVCTFYPSFIEAVVQNSNPMAPSLNVTQDTFDNVKLAPEDLFVALHLFWLRHRDAQPLVATSLTSTPISDTIYEFLTDLSRITGTGVHLYLKAARTGPLSTLITDLVANT